MKRLLTIIFLAISGIITAQQVKFILITNPEISDSKSASLIDSVASFANGRSDINFIMINGNLTKSGTASQIEILKQSLDKFSVQYILLPGPRDVRDANGWELLKEIAGDKFIYDENEYSFIGLSPVIPFTRLRHFTFENLEWLNSVLDTVRIDKDFYFISPSILDEEVYNWDQLFSCFTTKIPQLIINGNSEKPLLRNLSGYYVFNAHASIFSKNGLPDFIEFNISKDSIVISDNTNKIISVIDKTVKIEKDKFDTAGVQLFNSDLLMRTDLNYTMLTSTAYWNKKIYTSDLSGLVSCIDSTGKVLWDYDTNGEIYSKPVIADRIITAATLQGDIITLSAINGEQIQSIGFEETITSDLSVIDYSGSRELMIPKLTDSKSAVVFGTANGKLYCYDIETLQEYWVNGDAKGMIRSKPVYINNKILFTSRDGYLYCIDARDGLLIWRWKEKADTDLSDSQILSDGKKVFAISTEGKVYAINLLLGKLEWKLDNLNFITRFGISADNKSLYLTSKEKSLVIVQAEKGKIIREVKLDEYFPESLDFPIDAGNNILFSNKGTVYSLNERLNTNKVLFFGNAPIHPVIKISDNKFLVSNIDGRIIIFSLR